MTNLRIERRSAYGRGYRSYRKKQDRLPCCRGEEYDLYHHLMQLRNISFLLQFFLFYMYLQLDVGILLGLLSFL